MAILSHKWILPHYLEGTAYSRGEALALIEGERRVSYSHLRSQVFQVAAQLVHEGVGHGDRIVMLVANSIEFVTAFWAIQYVGAVAVPLNPGIKLAKLRWILADCLPSCLIVDASMGARDPGIQKMDLSSARVLWLRSSGAPSSPPCGTSSAPVAEWDVGSVAIDQDLACIIYTSGSTGTPKGVMLSHLNMVTASSSVCSYLGMVNDDRVFCAIPFSFDYGLHQITMTALVGATLIVESGFAQPLFSLHRLVQHRTTVFPIVPSMVSVIEPLARRFDFSSVRTVTSTAAPLHPSAIDRLQEMFPRARIFSMYGLTECHRCTYLDPTELAGRKSSVGKAIPNTELWVVDGEGKRHDRSATGELVIRGNTVMRGYWNNSSETNEKLRPGVLPGEVVLYTGDICTLDEDGFVYFVCRKDDVLKVKGQKVAPKEVEEALMQHPDVSEAAVVGLAQEGLEDEVVAFVSLREGSRTEPPALRTWCGIHLESFMLPRKIVILGILPKSANGKIDKLALKNTVEKRLEAPERSVRFQSVRNATDFGVFQDMVQNTVDRIVHTSDRIALLNDDGLCDFGTLGARCQGILDSISAAPEGVALIYGHKEVDAVAAMLACTLARRPFIFVDIGNPAPRIRRIAETSQAKVIICSQPLPGHLEGLIVETGSISSRPLRITRVDEEYRGLFYIAFTSGSTGTPKGVQIGYDNFACFYGWYSALLRCCRGTEAHVNHASFSFDMGMLDLWPSLSLGKPVILLNHRHNPLPLANLRMLASSAGVVPGSWFSTPSFLAMMCMETSFRESTLRQLRTFFVGGEPVPKSLVAKLMERFPSAEIWHAYGPTEVTCLTHCRRVTRLDLAGSDPLPLGRPIPPNEVRVVDEDGREVAAGECGEIELSGPQVAYGYLPKTHPQNALFGTRENKRFYRTGDYGRIDQEGNLTLSGRMDGQLKWNGNRVEIGEIERVAQNAIGVCQAVAVPLTRDNRVVDVILFVQMREDNDGKRAAFLNHLNGELPAYMRPRSIRFVDRLPVTLHGKIDRTRLLRGWSENITP